MNKPARIAAAAIAAAPLALGLGLAAPSGALAAGEHVRNSPLSVVPMSVSYDFTDLDGNTDGDASRSLAPGETLIGKRFGSGSAMNLNFARIPGGFRATVNNSVVGEYEIDRCDRYNSVTGTLIPGQDAHVALQPDQVNVINIQFCISAVPPA